MRKLISGFRRGKRTIGKNVKTLMHLKKILLWFIGICLLFSCSISKSKNEQKVVGNKLEESYPAPVITNPTQYYRYESQFRNSSKNFYLVMGKELYIYGSVMDKQEYTFEDEPEIDKTLGLKIGDKITWLDFETGILSVYTIHKKTKLRTKYTAVDDSPEATLLSLVDEINPFPESVTSTQERRFLFDGLATLEKDDLLQSSKVLPPKYEKASSYQYISKDDFLSFNNHEKFNEFIFHKSQYKNIEIVMPFFKYDNPNYPAMLSAYYGIYFNYLNMLWELRNLEGEEQHNPNPTMNLRIGNFIKGSEAAAIYEDESMHRCGGIIIFYKDHVEKVILSCDSGGC